MFHAVDCICLWVTVGEGGPAVVGGEVVDEWALEFLAFEYGFGGVGEFVDVLCDAGAPWVGDWVYTELDLVDEVEVWL